MTIWLYGVSKFYTDTMGMHVACMDALGWCFVCEKKEKNVEIDKKEIQYQCFSKT